MLLNTMELRKKGQSILSCLVSVPFHPRHVARHEAFPSKRIVNAVGITRVILRITNKNNFKSLRGHFSACRRMACNVSNPSKRL